MKSFTLTRIKSEMSHAEKRFGPFASTHEGYGVLAEEVAELLEAIRSNRIPAVHREAVQVAAVAARIAECCELPEFKERSGA